MRQTQLILERERLDTFSPNHDVHQRVLLDPLKSTPTSALDAPMAPLEGAGPQKLAFLRTKIIGDVWTNIWISLAKVYKARLNQWNTAVS